MYTVKLKLTRASSTGESTSTIVRTISVKAGRRCAVIDHRQLAISARVTRCTKTVVTILGLLARAVYTGGADARAAEKLTVFTGKSIFTNALVVVVLIDAAAPDTRPRQAVVDVRFAVGASKSRRTGTGVAADRRRRAGAVVARRRITGVDLVGAEMPGLTGRTDAFERAGRIAASTEYARPTAALVDVLRAVCARVTVLALALVLIDAVQTGAMNAGLRCAIIDVCLAVQPGEADQARAVVIDVVQVGARAVIGTR